MKTIKIYMALSFFLFMLSGCDLTDLNENPNEPDNTVDYNFNDPLLASLLRTGVITEGDVEQRYKSLQIDFYAQIADGGNFVTRNYEIRDDWNLSIYKLFQSNLASLNIIINSLSESGDRYKYTIAVAKIWRIYIQANAVDFFGPIPFASYKETVDNPPYTSVEDAYNEFFTELAEAAEMLGGSSEEPIFMDSASDIIFGNDNERWRKFANSLRLRYALRLSEVNSSKCTEEAQKAIAAGTMTGSDDNAYLPPKADGSWGQNYNYTMFSITWTTAINMTTTFEKLLTNIGGLNFPTGLVNKRNGLNGKTIELTGVHPEKVDPRATQMFDPGFEVGNWKGYPVGLSTTNYNSGEYYKNNYAEMGYIVKNGAAYITRPYDLFLYEEVCFLKAEAALRGFASGDAKSEYEKGVRASFQTWGVSDKADQYLASAEKNLAGTSANFDDQSGAGNTALEKIITQKYIAAFPDVAMESWSDKRRLNLPRFDVLIQRYELLYDNSNTNIKDPTNFIKRVQYPSQESQINEEEYNKGLQLLGGPDYVSTPIWWDKNMNYCTSAN
ncbi:MAG: SusD/RagB family nutrient-binding outer membrane lipoprotein [Tannerella sp.]|jgi:hypothetical protein|nr:SusD/RagB family nutrient-binding outer membrane lipoprotein [Tannerella sp.]